jgi:hypothetical protein
VTATIDPAPKKPRVALLIDGENISVAFAGQILVRASKTAHPSVKRVYGNAPQITGWDAAPGFRLMHSGSIKNGADILLSIDAVHLSHAEQIDTFAIATSDQDFSHLAHHLRERGFQVIGIGEEKAPLAFRKACTTFRELSEKTENLPKNIDKLDKQIHQLISKAPKREMQISLLNSLMKKEFEVKISEHPLKTCENIWNRKAICTNATLKAPLPRCDWRLNLKNWRKDVRSGGLMPTHLKKAPQIALRG